MSRKTIATAVLVAALAAACARETPAPAARVEAAEPVEAAAGPAPAAPPPVEVLRAWDAQRAEAWARGDPSLLAALYTPGSVAGRRDRAMLRAWVSRGLVVRGLRTQLLAVREVRRSRASWTLRVTDRLTGGVAVGPGVRRPLPVDAATTHTVVLHRLGGRWLVASVVGV
jgi:hypothetical protein